MLESILSILAGGWGGLQHLSPTAIQLLGVGLHLLTVEAERGDQGGGGDARDGAVGHGEHDDAVGQVAARSGPPYPLTPQLKAGASRACTMIVAGNGRREAREVRAAPGCQLAGWIRATG